MVSKEVVCDIKVGCQDFLIKIPMKIPSSVNGADLSNRIIQLHNLPVHIHDKLTSSLISEIKDANHDFYLESDRQRVESIKNQPSNIKYFASLWNSKYNLDKHKECLQEENEFASKYHSMVHSPSLNHLISVEQSYAEAVSSIVIRKEAVLEELQIKQDTEMQEIVKGVGTFVTDEKVNDVAGRHLEDAQLLEVKWDSTASALKDSQRREYRNLILNSDGAKEGVNTPITPASPNFMADVNVFSRVSSQESPNVDSNSSDPVKEESFTIHLGTQMKQMHNLRLLSADVLELLKYQQLVDGEISPQRIQTSMNLYSHNLNGLVLLVNDRVNSYTGIKKEFSRVCSRSTELHFQELEDQLEGVRNVIPEVVKWRREHPCPPQYEWNEENQTPSSPSQSLKCGDFYVSRHSNLPDVHVVFHLVVDEALSSSSDINSRHCAILGLRNILKVACLSDVTTLTVPLLLTHALSEEMTISWCQKRAELVYKCLKGFMIEMSSWGGAEMKNLQFLVPKGISDDLFNNLASMLQSIFRLSNPLVVKTCQ